MPKDNNDCDRSWLNAFYFLFFEYFYGLILVKFRFYQFASIMIWSKQNTFCVLLRYCYYCGGYLLVISTKLIMSLHFSWVRKKLTLLHVGLLVSWEVFSPSNLLWLCYYFFQILIPLITSLYFIPIGQSCARVLFWSYLFRQIRCILFFPLFFFLSILVPFVHSPLDPKINNK